MCSAIQPWLARHPACDSQRETFLAQQRVAAITRAETPNQFFFGEMHDESALGIEIAGRMHARHKVAGISKPIERHAAHARHDSHAGGDVCAVGHFHADPALRRIHRPHNVRNHIHRPAAITPSNSGPIFSLASAGAIQLFVGPASSLRCVADKRQIFRARHIVGIAAMQIAIRVSCRIQRQRVAFAHHFVEKILAAAHRSRHTTPLASAASCFRFPRPISLTERTPSLLKNSPGGAARLEAMSRQGAASPLSNVYKPQLSLWQRLPRDASALGRSHQVPPPMLQVRANQLVPKTPLHVESSVRCYTAAMYAQKLVVERGDQWRAQTLSARLAG